MDVTADETASRDLATHATTGMASPALRIGAALAYVASVCIPLVFSPAKPAGALELIGKVIGTMIGALIVPAIVVGLASLWKSNRTQKRRVAVFLGASLVMVLLMAAVAVRPMRMAAGPAWEFRSKDQRFALTLPSSNWRASKQTSHIADFWYPDLSPMLAAVVSIEAQELEDFQASAASFGAPERTRTIEGSARFDAGQTSAGNRYMVASWQQEAPNSEARQLSVALCRVWLADKKQTVALMLERHSKALSETVRAGDDAEFLKDANAICRSVR